MDSFPLPQSQTEHRTPRLLARLFESLLANIGGPPRFCGYRFFRAIWSRPCVRLQIIAVLWLSLWSTGVAAADGPTVLPSTENAADASSDADRQIPLRAERNVVFLEVDGQQLRADWVRPDNDTVYPLVLMIHGGAWSAGDKFDLIDHGREMAQAGFVVASINYRLAPSVKIGDQLHDCRAAAQWALKNADNWKADANKFFVWGYSAGAHLAALLSLHDHQDNLGIAAVVAGGAPCSVEFLPPKSRLLAHVFGGSREQVPKVYSDFSPLDRLQTASEASESQPPAFFLYHGDSDFLVPSSSSQAMFKALQERDINSEYLLIKGKGHWLTFLDTKARRAAIQFLQARSQELDKS